MNNESSSQNKNEPAADASPTGEPSSAPHSTRDPFANFSESVRNAMQNGGRDARRAFDEALPKAKEDLTKGIHDLAYALAYAAAFSGAIAREITPDTLKDGLRDGATSGKRAGEEMLRQRRERAAREACKTPPADSDQVPA